MADPFLGEVRIFAGTFAPRDWAFCNGQALPIAQNTALFSLLGTTYGGDGRTDFRVPDLQGRAVMGAGNGPGLTTRTLGETGGQATVGLTAAHLPSHGHAARVDAAPADDDDPQGGILASTPGAAAYGPASNLVAMSPDALTATGGTSEHANIQPYLVLNYIIAIAGLYPSRP